ncbi:MAG: putative ABC transporter permease [Lachnospiraceae bacterium]|nr:putative ABC transporter permease [Lachnospiraceae bacterium]
MIPYNINQLLFFFFIYCFIGWIIESTYVSWHEHKLTNRGFMRGPVIPIYGCGAMTLLLVSFPLLKWPVAVFFAGMFAASLMEYITGAIMEAVFKVRYWDYSTEKFNLNGYICLWTSVVWGLLSLALNYFLHKPIEALCFMLTDKELRLITQPIAVLFIVDLTLSFKAAFDIRAVIVYAEKAKNEIRLLQKRMDVVIACAEADMNEQKAKIAAGIDSIQNSISDRFEDLTKDFYKRGLFLGNPTIMSRKFKDTVDSVKTYVAERKPKNKDKQ